jgi:DNA-binding transcriptional LysR family regulator
VINGAELARDWLQVDNYLALMAFVAAGLGIAGVLLWVYFPR